MNIVFPSNPDIDDTFSSGDKIWKYDGRGWRIVSATAYANNVQFSPTGSIASLEVQSAIFEVSNEKRDIPVNISVLTYSPTVDLAFTDVDQRKSLTLTGNISFTASDISDKRQIKLFITGDVITRTLTFPAGWIFIGDKPYELAANKKAVFSLECTDSVDSGIYCVWGPQQ